MKLHLSESSTTSLPAAHPPGEVQVLCPAFWSSPIADTSRLFQAAETVIRSPRLLQTCESVEVTNSHAVMFVKRLLKRVYLNSTVSTLSSSVFCLDRQTKSTEEPLLTPADGWRNPQMYEANVGGTSWVAAHGTPSVLITETTGTDATHQETPSTHHTPTQYQIYLFQTYNDKKFSELYS